MAIVEKPTKMDEITVKKLEESAAMDCSVEEMIAYANISKQTYYSWLESFPDFKKQIDDLRQRPFLKARQSIVKGLDEPEFALKYMERKKKAEFALRTELTGKEGNPIETHHIDDVKFAEIISKYADKRDRKDSDIKKDI